MIIVASIIENLFVKVVTIGIYGNLIFMVAEVGATTLLVDGMEDMEELTDTRRFVAVREGIKLGKGSFDETRLGRKISWKADGAHTATVSLEVNLRGKIVDRALGGKMLVIIELEKLLIERRIISKYANRIVIDFEASGDRFYDDASGVIANDPMELGGRELIREREVTEVHLGELGFGFGDSGALR